MSIFLVRGNLLRFPFICQGISGRTGAKKHPTSFKRQVERYTNRRLQISYETDCLVFHSVYFPPASILFTSPWFSPWIFLSSNQIRIKISFWDGYLELFNLYASLAWIHCCRWSKQHTSWYFLHRSSFHCHGHECMTNKNFFFKLYIKSDNQFNF